MLFAPIVPVPMLSSISNHNYHMVLAGKCKVDGQAAATQEGSYANFYRQTSGFKILDNGIAEGEAVGTADLLWWAEAIKADEIVIPDVMHDAYATVDKIIGWHRYHFQVFEKDKGMAVLQATTWYEFGLILDTALRCRVTSVALPKLLHQHLGPFARLAAAEVIRSKDPNIPIHCLGCTKHLSEAKDLARQGIVRGIDTSAPVVLGLQGQSISHTIYDWEVSHSALPDFWNSETTDQVEENLNAFMAWCDV